MQLEVVNIEDVYPDENNPRKTFEGIAELAESFDLNGERPGEPVIPPILVKDGGIYRIIDGERRYKALKHLKAKSFTANVCTDMDEANKLLAMLATDDKQPLTELEKSRGVQQMLMLGVDPIRIEKVSKRDSSKLKKAIGMVQDAAEDMTLDRLMAIQEFDDDPETVEKLTNCSEKDWLGIADSAKRKRKLQEERRALTAALVEMGFTVLEEGQQVPSGYVYRESLGKVDESLKEKYSPEDVVISLEYSGTTAVVYKRKDASEDEEKAKRQAEVNRTVDLLYESAERRDAWFADRINEPKKMPKLSELAIGAFRDSNRWALELFEDDLQTPIALDPCPALLVEGYFAAREVLALYSGLVVDGKMAYYAEQLFEKFISTLDAFIADGYEPEEWEEELYVKVRAAAKKEGE